MPPLITIIIPAFNAEKFISRCVESILAQTYKNLEIIIVDDGSQDGTLNLLKAFAAKDARIKVISQKNAGPGAARNKALDIARGDYIGFVDADDYIAADMYETLLDIALKHSADIVCCNLSLDFGGRIETPPPVREGITKIAKEKAVAYAVNKISFGSFLCNKLFEAKLFKNFKIAENTFYEDYDAGTRLTAAADTIYYCAKNMYFYAQTNPNSTTHTHNTEKTIDHYKVSKEIFKFCTEKGFKEAALLAHIRLLDISITLLKARPGGALYEGAAATIRRDLRLCLKSNIKLRKKIFAIAVVPLFFTFKLIKHFIKRCIMLALNIFPRRGAGSPDKIIFMGYGMKAGDGIVTTFFLRELKKHFKNTRLTLALNPRYIPIFKDNPYIDELAALPQGFFNTISFLRKGNYGLIIGAPWGLSYKILFAYYLSKARKIFLEEGPFKYKFVTGVKKDDSKHITCFFADILRQLGAADIDTSYDLFLPPEDIEHAADFIKNNIPPDNRAILFNPQAATRPKTLADGKVSEIITGLSKLPGYKTILLSHDKIYDNLPENTVLFNSASLAQSAAVISKADYILTVDTGTVHMADAFNKNMLILASGIYDGRAASPNAALWASKNPKNAILKGENSVNEIKTEDILTAVKQSLPR